MRPDMSPSRSLAHASQCCLHELKITTVTFCPAIRSFVFAAFLHLPRPRWSIVCKSMSGRSWYSHLPFIDIEGSVSFLLSAWARVLPLLLLSRVAFEALVRSIRFCPSSFVAPIFSAIMVASSNGDLYSPLQAGIVEEGPQSSDDGSTLHSPSFDAQFPRPHRNDCELLSLYFSIPKFSYVPIKSGITNKLIFSMPQAFWPQNLTILHL